MGELSLHDLGQFDCNVFVETGTGAGTGLEYATTFPFRSLYSIEINKELYKKAVIKFKDKNIRLLNASSTDGLKEVCKKILTKDRCLFFLDAHFPGADFQMGSYDDYLPKELKYPLLTELETIKKLRPKAEDTIIIDDLQLYEPDGDYELKAKDEFLKKHGQSIDFKKMFGATHTIKREKRHQGVLIMIPKKREAREVILSILIPTTPKRVSNCCPKLVGYLDRQIERLGDSDVVELLWLGDNYHMSVGEKRNRLLDLARGKYLVFIDDDDSVHEKYIEKILSAISKNPKADAITYACITRVDGKNKTISNYSSRNDYTEWLDTNGVMQWRGKVAHTMVWVSRIAKKHKFPEKNWGEDMHWVKRANADIRTEHNMSEPLYYYRMYHGVSETRDG